MCCTVCDKCFSDEDAKNEITNGINGAVIFKLPVITEGNLQIVTYGEKKALPFSSDANYAEFRRVFIDGKELDSANYTVKDGIANVTLKEDYVATLSVGEHTLGIESVNGTTTAKFTVNKKAAETTTTDNTKFPQTGDNSNITLWLALLLVSGGAVVATKLVGKKKKYHK